MHLGSEIGARNLPLKAPEAANSSNYEPERGQKWLQDSPRVQQTPAMIADASPKVVPALFVAIGRPQIGYSMAWEEVSR